MLLLVVYVTLCIVLPFFLSTALMVMATRKDTKCLHCGCAETYLIQTWWSKLLLNKIQKRWCQVCENEFCVRTEKTVYTSPGAEEKSGRKKKTKELPKSWTRTWKPGQDDKSGGAPV
jgi:hypothetical protein